MHSSARQRALSTSCGPRLLSGRRLAALALVPLLALACGGPGDPVTSQTASDPTTTTDETSTGSTSSSTTTGGPVTEGPVTEGPVTEGPVTEGPGTETSTDATTGQAGDCAQMCERTSECTPQVTLEQCIAACEATDDELRACVFACDQPVCEDLLMCTTLCAHEGDPNATPYATCEDGASTCQPGVYMCIVSAHDGLEFSVCTPFCDDEGECPTPATGTATPQCDLDGRPHVCSLDCSGGQQCPDDMVCDLQGSGLCMWPVE
ncbi:hypothetical protein OV203_10510 [Nannocystis sp. ILAH1]|uniref:hypothetical protein n=1 Tax=unclassified Nannocystis TaxID=2627009 RepID=UPI00226DEC69|nr:MULTISPECIES: hypothetical protein [unclassified Nannocystis]MCY0987557.1 hypothetical protein [Nannocystis sp. ILAH1]MCY1070646.1 hypothetical protein [Nannocystis sp. RBIL2]